MKHFIFLFFFCVAILPLSAELSHTVLVTVAPHKFFVEQIAGDTATVQLMVPAGASAHTYEPSPKEMMRASHADAWFFIGESFETRAKAALSSHKPDMLLVDLRQNVSLIFGGCCEHHKEGADLHFWLSPNEAKKQARTIADALTKLYPENAALYQKRLDAFINKLTQLDLEIQATLKNSRGTWILVSHPAYAYFCRDYGLVQISIEMEGKDPTPRQLTNLFTKLKGRKVSSVFYQPQYNHKGASLISQSLGAKLIMLDPYAEDYINTMREIAQKFTDA